MRIRILFITAIFFLLSISTAQASIIGKPSNNLGLAGYWTFNEGAGTVVGDSSGNRNGGTLVNNPTWVPGKFGEALSFNGVDQYVTVGTSSMPANDAANSASVWVYYDSVPAGAQQFLSRTNGLGTFMGFHDLGGVCSGVSLGAWRYAGPWFVCIAPPAVRTWHHVVYTYDGSTFHRLYVDGVEVDNENSVAPNNGVPDTILIGAYYSGENFAGKIDDVRIYRRELSAAEVKSMYNTSSVVGGASASVASGGLNRGLVGYWTFDGTDHANYVADKSGFGNNGYFGSGDIRDATTTTKGLGKIGQALRFPRTGYATSTFMYTDPTGTSLKNLTKLTISAWVKLDSGTSYPQAIYAGATNGSQPADAPSFLLDTTGGANYLLFETGYSDFSTGIWYTSNNAITPGQWTHLMVTFDTTSNANDPVFYINGVATTTFENAPPNLPLRDDSSFPPPFIGAYGNVGFTSGLLKGSIDDLRVYNRVLSAAEAKQLANSGSQKINSSAASTTGASSLTRGLEGHWTFDGPDVTDKVYDRSGKGRHGYMVDKATTSAKVLGKLGQAFKFDGQFGASPNYVDVGQVNVSGAITISAWIKPSARALAPSTDCDSGCDIISSYNVDGSEAQYELSLGSNGVIGYSTVNSSVNTGGGTANPVILQANRWYHVVMTRNAKADRTTDDVNFYIDGVDQPESLFTAQPSIAGFGNTTIGRDGDIPSTVFYFPGLIDDVRIYSRELTPSEVKQLYNLGK